MSWYIMGIGLVAALFVGAGLYYYFKIKGKRPVEGFAWGFFSTLLLAAGVATAYFFHKKKK